MIKKLAAVIAAAISAGFIVAFVPGLGPEAASGATQSLDRGTASSVRVNTAALAVAPAPAAAAIPAAAGIHFIGCEKSWPYYEASCMRGMRQAETPRVVRVINVDRAPAGRPVQARR